jgi:hypothetical protein
MENERAQKNLTLVKRIARQCYQQTHQWKQYEEAEFQPEMLKKMFNTSLKLICEQISCGIYSVMLRNNY